MKRFSLPAAIAGAVVGLGAALYVGAVRPWHLRWGATPDEATRSLPGDEIVPEPDFQTTRAVTIAAAPGAVWPWLVQLGRGRGGFYSYDWLENLAGLGIHSADRIIPELQNLKEGDSIPTAPEPHLAFRVVTLQPERALVTRATIDLLTALPAEPGDTTVANYFDGTWGFYLEEIQPGTTRLLARLRAVYNHNVTSQVFTKALLEPGHFVMERKMLLGIKERAEGLSTQA